MTFTPKLTTLRTARELVRKRANLKQGEPDTVLDAVREDALPLYVEGVKKDGAWYLSQDVWWPSSLMQSWPKDGQTSVNDIMVETEVVDRLWPDPIAPARKADLTARERNTLLKLVLGMAIDGYGFDPAASRSPIAREISDALRTRGISISDDTVRNYLTEAANAGLHEET